MLMKEATLNLAPHPNIPEMRLLRQDCRVLLPWITAVCHTIIVVVDHVDDGAVEVTLMGCQKLESNGGGRGPMHNKPR